MEQLLDQVRETMGEAFATCLNNEINSETAKAKIKCFDIGYKWGYMDGVDDEYMHICAVG